MKRILFLTVYAFGLVLASSPAMAARTCTNTITTGPHGEKIIEQICTGSHTKTNEILRNPNDLQYKMDQLTDTAERGTQAVRDKMQDMDSKLDQAQALAADTAMKQENFAQAQKDKQQDQQAKMASLREQAQMQKQRQQAMMDQLRSRSNR